MITYNFLLFKGTGRTNFLSLHKKNANFHTKICVIFGGEEGIRTPDPLGVNEMLYRIFSFSKLANSQTGKLTLLANLFWVGGVVKLYSWTVLQLNSLFLVGAEGLEPTTR